MWYLKHNLRLSGYTLKQQKIHELKATEMVNQSHSLKLSNPLSFNPVKMKSLPPANEVCEGYIFTGVCLSTRGGGVCHIQPPRADTSLGSHPLGRHPSGGDPLSRHTPLGRQPPWADTPGHTRPGQTPPPPAGYYGIRSTSGRYASYWNVFLFNIISSIFFLAPL